MDSDTYKYCLEDMGKILDELSCDARKSYLADKNDFNKGQLFAYYNIISTLQQQAKAFGIDLKSIHLHDINPDEDFLI